MKDSVKYFFKLLVVLAVIAGIAGAILHHSTKQTEIAHHEDTCEVCAIYQSTTTAFGPAPILFLLFVAFVALVYKAPLWRNDLFSFESSYAYSGLDPPIASSYSY